MATKRINDLTTITTVTPSVDVIAIDDIDSGTRKITVDALVENSTAFTNAEKVGVPVFWRTGASIHKRNGHNFTYANIFADSVASKVDICVSNVSGASGELIYSLTKNKAGSIELLIRNSINSLMSYKHGEVSKHVPLYTLSKGVEFRIETRDRGGRNVYSANLVDSTIITCNDNGFHLLNNWSKQNVQVYTIDAIIWGA